MTQMTPPAFLDALETRLSECMTAFRDLHQHQTPEQAPLLKAYFQQLFSLQTWFQENRDQLNHSGGDAQRDKQYELLYKSSLLLEGAFDRTELLNLALDTLLEMSGCGRGFIALIKDEEQLDFIAARDFQKENIPQPEHEISQSVIRRVRSLQEEVSFDQHAAADSLLQKSSLVQRDGSALICVPLLLDEQVVGVIYLDQFKSGLTIEAVTMVRRFTVQLSGFMKSATRFSELKSEQQALLTRLKKTYSFDRIICKSKAMVRILQTVAKVAKTEVGVLIQGETGTGKDLIARALHENSGRKRSPYIEVDCGALPDNLVESELFGHAKGSFTGAHSDRVGLLEAAEGGTLFLDEINNLPLSSQTKLLRAVQQRRIRRLGETKERTVNFRLIAASSKQIKELVASDQFRQDLFYRINTVTLDLPPLRERREDLLLLAERFLAYYCNTYERSDLRFDPRVLTALEGHTWPGNVRELEHVIERAVILCEGDRVQVTDLPFEFHGEDPWAQEDEVESLEQFVNRSKKHYISRILLENKGNKAETARQLQVNRSYLFQLLKQLGIA